MSEQNGIIYAIQPTEIDIRTGQRTGGDLLWFRHDGWGDGSFRWASNEGKKVGNRWNAKHVFSGGDGIIYALMENGDLLWFRHDGWIDGSFRWASNEGKKVGNRWNAKQVFSGGDGIIYALMENGDLLWYRHDGRSDGSFRWASNEGKKVGNRWIAKQVFSGGDGIIYALMENGDLLWYRHDGRSDGSFKWASNEGKKVGNGWNAKQVFSGGDGIIYALMENGDLLWYRHDGRSDGSFKWASNEGKKVGNGWNAKQVFFGGTYEEIISSSVRLMPLGDSITEGYGDESQNGGYRGPLRQKLVAAGYTVDFIGTLSAGGAGVHEGDSGKGAHEIAANVYSRLTDNPPDIVLLHIGTNSILHSVHVADITSDIAQILTNIDHFETASRSRITVILAQIINQCNPAGSMGLETTRLNSSIAAMAATRIADGDRLVVANFEPVLSYHADLADEVHPNASGYAKMATVWFDALVPVFRSQ